MEKENKGKYIAKKEFLQFFWKGYDVRKIKVNIENLSEKRIYISPNEIKLIKKLLNEINTRILKNGKRKLCRL